MHVSATTRSVILKAFRVFLVFTLVFWGTFRIELAVADDEQTPPATDTSQNEGTTPSTDEPTNTDPQQPSDSGNNGNDDNNDDNNQGTDQDENSQGNNQGNNQGDNNGQQNNDQSQNNVAEDSTLDHIEICYYIDNPNEEQKKKAVPNAGDVIAKSNSASKATPKIDTLKGEKKFYVVIYEKGKQGKAASKQYVEWDVPNASQSANANFGSTKQQNPGTLKATGESSDMVEVTCRIKKDIDASYKLSSDVVIKFNVELINQEGPFIETIAVLDKDGKEIAEGSTLKLDLENDKVAYQFSALVTVRDPSAKDSAQATHSFSTADASGLGEEDKKLLDSLKWSIKEVEGASIDESGLFKANAKLETTVMCESDMGPGKRQVYGTAVVNTGLDVGVQGAYDPQSYIIVKAPSEVVKVAGEESEGQGASSSVQDPTEKADQSASMTAQAEGADSTDSTGTSTSGEKTGSTDGSTETAEKPKPDPIEKRYSLDELGGIESATVESTLQGRIADAPEVVGAKTGTTTISGYGPQLAALLEDAGVDLTKVRSVTFINSRGDTKTIAWSRLESGAILAESSVVHVEGESENPTQSDFLKNTRFRLLPASSASLDEALSWVNTIQVNGDGSGSGGSSSTDSSLRAVIGYAPVAMGSTAYLSAAVVGLYQSEQFGYEWQTSGDGSTWTPTGDTSQTLRVPTSAGTIGRMYRVVATTSSGRTAESQSVVIQENTGFSVAVAYDPPLAGGMAIFTTSVTGIDVQDILPNGYIWEWTEDGGATWTEIAGSRGKKTFSTKTDPVNPSSGGKSTEEGDGTGSEGDGTSSGSSESADKEVDTTPAPSIWIHVRVLATEGREAVSNPVMLTVHVSEDPGTGQPAVDEPTENLPDEPSAPGSDESVVTPTETDKESGAGQPSTGPVMQEVTSISVETAPRAQSSSGVVTTSTPATQQTPDGTQTSPTPATDGSDSPTDLVVNPTITAEIIEQRQAVNEAVAASHPGARWTALSTVDPDGKDVQRILSENPFAPLTLPFALGLTAAGAVEKVLGFRRQTK